MTLAIDQVRREASGLLNVQRRADLGQYFTPSSIAEFMAKLFSYPAHAKLLDAGAGVGSLTSAFFEQALQQRTQVKADVWEIDPLLGNYLQTTLDDYVGEGAITAHIHLADFIEEATLALQLGIADRYTHAILNPPYKKIHSQSKHRHLLRSVGIETVNLYAAFVALTVLLMEQGGEIVAILPRSFCNGSYYRAFRTQILQSCAIRQLHLFESRSQAFQEDAVLQENVIIHLVKGAAQDKVIISTSQNAKFLDYQEVIFAAAEIIKHDDAARFIHIPITTAQTIRPALCTHTLNELGLAVCTGPVVDFRVKSDWLSQPNQDSIPLLYPHHFSTGTLCWPKVHKKPNALQLSTEVKKWLMPRGDYVLVKRFSSKEELRRLVAYYLPYQAVESAWVAFENHWNVIHVGKQGMAADIAKGLTTFLNSTLLDQHFRVFSGHTQVNATDLRTMRYPSLTQLRTLGQRAGDATHDQISIDRLVEELTQDD